MEWANELQQLQKEWAYDIYKDFINHNDIAFLLACICTTIWIIFQKIHCAFTFELNYITELIILEIT